MKLEFKNEEEAIEFVTLHIPFAVRPKKKSKAKFINPFISNHAFEQVCKYLGKSMFEKQKP